MFSARNRLLQMLMRRLLWQMPVNKTVWQLMDGVMWVHHERTAAMKQKITDGTLGKLRRVTAAFTFNWDTIPVGNIRAMKEFAGGSLGDLGYYCVRAILWAFEQMPTQVFATARYKVGCRF